MLFHEKFDALMKITATSNSSLAKSMSVDASYISRLRRGERAMPKDPALVTAMAQYFCKKCTEEYMAIALLNFMDLDSSTDISPDRLEELIHQWLTEKEAPAAPAPSGTVGNLLFSISNASAKREPHPASSNNFVVFYGAEGKRQATLAFLNMVLANGRVHDLLLYSDENPDWMVDNPSFSSTWTELISKIVKTGTHIKIIHKVSRDINEMLHVINQWLPLYLTGNVEPYYYPHLRDGVYKRTLYVAPKLAAISSSSIGNITDGTANMLMTDVPVVDSFTNEFYNYLSLCKSLINIYHSVDAFGELCSSRISNSNTTAQCACFSSRTLPVVLHRKFLRRGTYQDPSLYTKYEELLSGMEPFLEQYSYTNLGCLPTVEEIRGGQVKVPLSNILYGTAVYYTPEEFKEHLTYVIGLLRTYPNFHHILLDENNLADNQLCVSEHNGIMIYQDSFHTALEIQQEDMQLAFTHYITNHKNINLTMDREETIAALEALLAAI